MTTTAGPLNFVTTTPYLGRELAPSARAGAMDAFKVPSMQNGERVEHRVPTTELGRYVKQSTDHGGRW